MIELRTLGSLDLISADGTPFDSVLTQPRRTALLCYLSLASPRGFRRRDTLLALFWPEHNAEKARHALRQSVYFLRHALGAAAVVSRGDDELAVAPDRVRCDAAEFERAIDEGRLEAALALYRGELLPGFHVSDAPEFERWLDAERSRLRQRAAEAAWALAEARERDGNPEPAARERVLISDFTNLTPDSTFGELITTILRSELAQSPLLGVVGPETIADALRRMRRQPGTRLTAGVARELAAREEIKVVVEGDVRPAGAGLVITTAVIETASGDAIHGASETARDSTEILPAIERLSNAIRQGIGESLASIRAGDSLNSFTTSSLPALRKHMAGSRALWSGD